MAKTVSQRVSGFTILRNRPAGETRLHDLIKITLCTGGH